MPSKPGKQEEMLPADTGLMPDGEVVERVRDGETALFEILMRRYNQLLYRAARAITGNAHEAEDVVQEAYVRAYLHLDQYEGRAKFSTWLTKIAVNEALARRRERSRLVGVDSMTRADDNRAPEATDPERETLRRVVGMVLEAAVDALPITYRSVFVLRAVEGMSTADTAECLGLSEEAVKVRLHRARAMLRKDIYARTGADTASAFQFLGPRCDRLTAAVMERVYALRARG